MRFVVVLAGLAACYPGVDNSDCEIRCGEEGACPSNLRCANTFCVAEGQVCQVPDLMAAYSFDALAGMTITDDSGNGHTARSASSLVSIPGPQGSAIEMSGDQSATVSHDSTLELDGRGFTISMFLRIDVAAADQDMAIVAKLRENGEQNQPSYEWGIEFLLGSQRLGLFMTDGDVVQGGPFEMDVPVDSFFHVAFTFDGMTVRGYLDGVRELDQNFGEPFAIGNFQQDLVIGADGRREQNFSGAIDTLRIYKRVLAQSELDADRATPLTPLAGQ